MPCYRAFYVVPREGDGNQAPVYAGAQIIVEDQLPVKTGLCDARGVPLYRMPECIPAGFQPVVKKAL